MNKLIATFFIAALLLGAVDAKKKSHNKKEKIPDYSKYTDEQVKKAFSNLKNHEAGLEVFTTIQLEMTNGTGGDWIDTALEVLEDLSKTTQDKIKDLNGNLNKRRNYCDEKIDEVKTSIYRSEKQIGEDSASIPVFQEELIVKNDNIRRLQSEQNVKIHLLENLNRLNEEGRQAYVDARRDHDDMISVLAQSKIYIAALKENNFLQKSNSAVLAQIQAHAKKSIDALRVKHHRGIFFYLAEISNSLATQADGKLVDQVLNLIDELIDYEKNAKQIDFEVEELRQQKYEADFQILTEAIEVLDSMVLSTQNNVNEITKRVQMSKENIDEAKGFVVLKNNELKDFDRSCSNDIESLQLQVSNNRNLLAIVSECVGLFSAKAKELRNSLLSI